MRVLGILGLVGGLWAYLAENSNVQTCQSLLGQLGQGVSGQISQQCQTAQGVHVVGLIVAVSGGVVFLITLGRHQHS